MLPVKECLAVITVCLVPAGEGPINVCPHSSLPPLCMDRWQEANGVDEAAQHGEKVSTRRQEAERGKSRATRRQGIGDAWFADQTERERMKKSQLNNANKDSK